MAIKLPGLSDTLRVILRIDDAIAHKKTINQDGEEIDVYEQYLDTLDESLLEIVPGKQPTYFVMRKVLPQRFADKVDDKKMKTDDKGKSTPSTAFVTEEVRLALVDIINPDNVPEEEKIIYKRDSDGGTSKDLIAQLHAVNVLYDLYRAKNPKNDQNESISPSDKKK